MSSCRGSLELELLGDARIPKGAAATVIMKRGKEQRRCMDIKRKERATVIHLVTCASLAEIGINMPCVRDVMLWSVATQDMGAVLDSTGLATVVVTREPGLGRACHSAAGCCFSASVPRTK